MPEQVAAIVEGVAEGCRRAGCALLGGETAEHPGVMPADQFDLAGFCVGVVQEGRLLGPHLVRPDDVLIGLPSSGLHANGYSLVREALLDRHDLASTPPGLSRALADELLEPCTIYARLVAGLARADLVHAAAHITGGGIVENLPRALPDGLGAEIDRGSWPEPEIFSFVQRESGAGDGDMFSTFNMGVGMVLVVAPDRVAETIARAPGASPIGRVAPGAGVRIT